MNMHSQTYPLRLSKQYQKMKQARRVSGQYPRASSQSTFYVYLHILSTTVPEREFWKTQGQPRTSASRRRRVASLRSSDVIVQLKVTPAQPDQILHECSPR